MLSTKVHKARQLASHALPLTRRTLSLGKGLLHKVTGLAGRLLGAVGRCVRQVTDYLLESKAVRLLLELIDSGGPGEVTHKLIAPRLVERNTCCSPQQMTAD